MPQKQEVIKEAPLEAVVDEDWFEEIYRAHLQDVMRLLVRGFSYRSQGDRRFLRINSAFEAEELAQETFSEFYHQCRKGNFDRSRPAKPYLLQIAVNRSLTHIGKSIREVPSDQMEFEPVAPQTREEENQRQSQLEEFLATLSDSDRAVHQLYYRDELTQHDVARQLSLSRDQVYRALVRIKSGATRYFKERGWLNES